ITGVIRRQDPLSVSRQMLESLGAQLENQTHQYPIHRIKKARSRTSNRPEGLNPTLLFLVEGLVRLDERIDQFTFATLCHFAQEIAHGLDPTDRLRSSAHTAGFGDFACRI